MSSRRGLGDPTALTGTGKGGQPVRSLLTVLPLQVDIWTSVRRPDPGPTSDAFVKGKGLDLYHEVSSAHGWGGSTLEPQRRSQNERKKREIGQTVVGGVGRRSKGSFEGV